MRCFRCGESRTLLSEKRRKKIRPPLEARTAGPDIGLRWFVGASQDAKPRPVGCGGIEPHNFTIANTAPSFLTRTRYPVRRDDLAQRLFRKVERIWTVQVIGIALNPRKARAIGKPLSAAAVLCRRKGLPPAWGQCELDKRNRRIHRRRPRRPRQAPALGRDLRRPRSCFELTQRAPGSQYTHMSQGL